MKNNLLSLFKQKKLRIGVLLGGFSSERKISLKSGRAVARALRFLGHPVKDIDVKNSDVLPLLKNIDFVFIVLHGKFGEDGVLQGILEKRNIPYTGPGPKASQVCFDKAMTKKILVRRRIPTAPYVLFLIPHHVSRIPFGFPLVVKPCREGSSVGVSIVRNGIELKKALKAAAYYDKNIIIERFIGGREVTVGILGRVPLPLVEVRPKDNFYSFSAKYKDKKTEYIVNSGFPAKTVRRIQEVALRAYKAAGCSGFSRVDIIYSKKLGPCVLEINTIPGMTERSLLPKAAKAVGLEFPQLCQKIVELSLTS